MITKLIVGRIMPMGVAAFLLKSSASPIKPALAAFGAATNALAGQSADDSGANFDAAAQAAQGEMDAAQQAASGGGLKAMLENLFGGGSHPDQAKKQLDDIINKVKQQGGGDQGPAPQNGPADQVPIGQPAPSTGGKRGGHGGAKTSGKK